MEFIVFMQMYHSFYKLPLSFLNEVADMSKVFKQHIKENVLQLLFCSFVMQNIQIFYGGPVMFYITCYQSINWYKKEEPLEYGIV